MPWVKIDSEAHKAMKEYLVDIEGINLGDLVEAAFEYAMQNIKDFEDFLELDAEEGEEEGETEDGEEETAEEEED